MKDERKTKQQLIADLAALRAQIAALESSVQALRKSEEQLRTTFSMDVSKQEQFEERLRDSEERYRSLVETAHDAIYTVDSESRIVSWNHAAELMYGYSRDEILGRDVAVIMPERFRPMHKKLFTNLIDTNSAALQNIPSEGRGLRKDGSELITEQTFSMFRTRAGTVFTSIARNISERKRAEAALQQSEHRYKRLTEALTNYIFSVRVEDGRPVATTHSPGCLGVTGFTPEEFARNQYLWISMVHPDDQSAVRKQAQEILAGHSILPLEHRIIRKDGAERWVRNTFVSHVDGAGRLLSYEGLIEDITERKQVELKLGKLYQCFLKFGPDPMENISRLTALCGELLHGTCALYNRLERGLLCAWGRWQTPADFNPIDRPDGNICYDIIRQASDSIVVLRNLPQTTYAAIDPNILKYGLGTYVGKAVKLADTSVGSLCVLYQSDYVPTDQEQDLMGLIASAIAVEEKRKQAQDERKRLIAILESTDNLVATATLDGQLTYVNSAGRQMLGLGQEENVESLHIDDCHPPWALQIVVKEGIPAAIREGTWTGETALLHRDGTETPVTQTIMSHKSQSGDVEYLSAIMADISQRKQAEREIIEAKDFLENIFATAFDGKVVTDARGYIIKTNRGLEHMLGYAEEELKGLHMAELAPQDQHHLDSGIEMMASLREKGYVESHEAVWKRKDGSRCTVEFNIAYLRDKQGVTTGTVGSVRNITERKRAETQLIESENRYRTVFENTGTAMILFDNDTIISMANSEAEKLSGYSRKEIEHEKSWTDFIAREDLEKMTDFHRQRSVDPSSVPKNYECRFLDRWGKEHSIYLTISVVPGSTVRVASLVDLTEYKRAEEERNRLITAIEQASETVLIIGTDGRVLYANPSVVQTMGYSFDDLIGTKPFPLIGSRDISMKQLFEDAWSKVIAGTAWSGRISERKKDGTPCELEITVSPVRNSAGDITSFVSIGRDITREVQLEEQLRQSQKMEAIGTLAGGIAHDFNNILTAILGNAEMASCTIDEQTQAGRYLKQIIKATSRASDLIKQILVFSRKGIHERKLLRLHLVLPEVLTLLRASLPSTIEIRQNIQKHDDAVIADITQIHQVMLNLGANAADAMRETGGVLEVSLEPLRFEQNDMPSLPDLQPGPYVRLSVRDTGIGIDPEIRDRIFDPFFTTKELGKGTGMGLAVVHGIVKGHGGAIQVESRPGQGTTFHIFLPTCEGDVAAEGELHKSSPGGTETILFVDDEEILVDVSRQMLESLGYTVIAMTSSSEALDIFAVNPNRFDIVITDQTMPHMTGYEFARRLLEIRPDIPVILCTGYSETVSPEKAHAIGIRQFIMKPISRSEIAATVRTILDAGRSPAT